MASASRLTLAFINKRPSAAARVLETLPIEDAAAFIETVPTRYATKVLAPLNTNLVSVIVERLPAESATAILRDMEFALASAVLRRVHRDRQHRIMAELPERRRQDFKAVMKFPADSVGANMSTALVTALSTETVTDALKRVRADRTGQSDAVFVIDESHKLLGAVSLSILTRQRPKAELRDLLDKRCPAVAARSRVSQIATLTAWHQYNQLPVISRRGELIGIIYKHAVAAEVPDKTGRGLNQPSIVESLLHTMLGSAQAAVTPPSQTGFHGRPSDER